MPQYITIELSKTGKYAGKYKAVVSAEDTVLASLNWRVMLRSHTNYAIRTYKESRIPMTELLHRTVIERVLGYKIPEGLEVDHIDHDGLNCTRPNLRLATHRQNSANQRKPINNKSGFRGVSQHKDRWKSQLSVNGQDIYLGLFDTPKLAYLAWCVAAKEHYGEFVYIPELKDES